MSRPALGQPATAGLITAIVGFSGAFAVVLAGLRGVGASEAQAASGLLVLSVSMGLLSIALSLRTRMPIAIAWSTPGAALLASAGAVEGGWPAAVGAFAVCGALLLLAGLFRPLGRWIGAIPAPIASAMLAGVLLTVGVEPAKAVGASPAEALPVVVVWAVLAVFARRWAVPGALVAAGVVIAIAGDPVDAGQLAPSLTFTSPVFEPATLIGIAVPLFLVTMASQNVTGLTVLASFGYRPDLRPVLASTGAATVAIAPFGGHAVNLAAITAALAAGPEAGPDRSRRWIAAVTNGFGVIAFGLTAGIATAVALAAPDGIVETVAGLALLPPLAGALAAAADAPDQREAAALTLVVSASGMTIAGITAPFWGLVAGLALLGLQRLAGQRAAQVRPQPGGRADDGAIGDRDPAQAAAAHADGDGRPAHREDGRAADASGAGDR